MCVDIAYPGERGSSWCELRHAVGVFVRTLVCRRVGMRAFVRTFASERRLSTCVSVSLCVCVCIWRMRAIDAGESPMPATKLKPLMLRAVRGTNQHFTSARSVPKW